MMAHHIKDSCFPGFCQSWVVLIVTFWVSGVELQLSALVLLQSAMRDLVDVFGPSSDPAPQPDDLWNAVRSAEDVTSDPWDAVGVCCVRVLGLYRLFRFSLCVYRLSVFSQKCSPALLSGVLGCHLLPPPIRPTLGHPSLTLTKAPRM